MAERHTAKLTTSISRAFGGALIFSMPVLMTMEMWDLGFVIERPRLLLLLAASFPLMMFLSHYSGFEGTWGWQEDLRDVLIAYGVATLMAGSALLSLGVLQFDMSAEDFAGKIAIQIIPGALGALLARSQFGDESKDAEGDDTLLSELGVMAAGALFLSLNVAPTEEMRLIAYKMTAFHTAALVPITLLVMHAFVYASGFSQKNSRNKLTSRSAFLKFTVPGYALSLIVASYLLWTFSHFDGLSIEQAMRVSIVLGLPASIGAAAARIIL
ncbi:MAG: TIGR02587 family membrane protein [Kaiparowitsia implicata GSE-PSE-MK54-09C]|jgi:putative integral membrane protein (TIGR02587 family)|nr:TIGR02587 family membrane protein [Kaiparowitsia implicata GSE-PSE-MK54-09C]